MSTEVNSQVTYKDRRFLLTIIGVIALSIGGFAAVLGPAEMYCFYLFAEGGRFHYPGFGFGSFMFGNIACQIVGYYVVAALFIPLGYGHLAMRRWVRTLALTSLWVWLILGIPLILALLFTLFSVKEMSMAAALVVVVLLGISYFALPGVLIRFYQGRDVRLSFETREPIPCRIEKVPLPILVVCSLSVFYVVVLHLLILFNGLFPAFGAWMSGLQGIVLLDVSIVCLAALIWGMFRLKVWAWWGAWVYLSLLASSSIWTLARSSWSDLLSVMRLPPVEMGFLKGLPFHGRYLAALAGIPLLITLGLIVFSRRYFKPQATSTPPRSPRASLTGAPTTPGSPGTSAPSL
jgi:hypothetical protein